MKVSRGYSASGECLTLAELDEIVRDLYATGADPDATIILASESKRHYGEAIDVLQLIAVIDDSGATSPVPESDPQDDAPVKGDLSAVDVPNIPDDWAV